MNNGSNRPKSNIIKPIWVDTPSGLERLLAELQKEPLVAVDTESDSLYSYYEKVCLIQFSTSKADYVVDPLATDVSGLAAFFADESIQKVFHAAEYDFLSLKRDYGFTFANLFDTMVAARVLGWNPYGLGALLDQHFGVKLDKRFQRYNWGQRPLGQKALDYAHLDTHYLIPLRELQREALEKQNRFREAQEAFERITRIQPVQKVFDPDDFWRIKGSRELRPQQQAVLRELFVLRDKIARKLDRPPFKVMNDAILLKLARVQPENSSMLQEVKGLSDRLLEYNGADILKAIRQAQTMPPPDLPTVHHWRDDNTMARYEVLRQWRNSFAAQRGVEPDVIISNQTLMDIARQNPRTLNKLTKMGVLGEWQFETYGKTLLQVLKNATP